MLKRNKDTIGCQQQVALSVNRSDTLGSVIIHLKKWT